MTPRTTVGYAHYSATYIASALFDSFVNMF